MRGPVGGGRRAGGARHRGPVRGGRGGELGAMDNRSGGRRRGVDAALRRPPVRLAARGAVARRHARRGRRRERRRPLSRPHCRRGAGTPGDGGAARGRPAMGARDLAVHARGAARRVASRSRRGGAAHHGARRPRHHAGQPSAAPRRGAGAAHRRALRTDPRECRSRPRDAPGRSRRGAHAPGGRASARLLRHAPGRRARWRRHHPAAGAGPNAGIGGVRRRRAARRYGAPHHPGLRRRAVRGILAPSALLSLRQCAGPHRERGHLRGVRAPRVRGAHHRGDTLHAARRAPGALGRARSPRAVGAARRPWP